MTRADYSAAHIRRVAEAASLDDDALADTLAGLEEQSRLATHPEEDLSEAAYAWLFVLQEERRRRETPRERLRLDDDGQDYADPRDYRRGLE
jgi:hypothetical protein